MPHALLLPTAALAAASLAAALAGCDPYRPSFEGLRCSPSGACPGTLTCVEGVCQEGGEQQCGDGLIVGDEACDDGNTDAADGCNATCDVATCYVPSTHPTVAEGLADAACPTVYVHAGTRAGPLVVARAVTLVGVGASPAVLDGDAAGSVVTIEPGVTATLKNLTVRNGRAASGGGILNQGNLALEAVTVTENTALADSPRGGGIANLAGALTLTRSLVTSNHVATASVAAPELLGGGIYSSGGSVRLEGGSVVERNDITAAAPGAVGRGAGLYATGTTVTVTGGSSVRLNKLDLDGRPGKALASGGGLYVDGNSLTVNADSLIDDNQVIARGADVDGNTGAIATGGGFVARNTASTFDHAFIRGNRATAQGEQTSSTTGGGGFVAEGSINLNLAAFVGNAAVAEGLGAGAGLATATAGGLFLDNTGGTFTSSSISSNTVTAGTASPSAGNASAGALRISGIGATPQALTLLRCTLDGNTVTSLDGAASIGGLSANRTDGALTVNLTGTTISHNVAKGEQTAEVGGVEARASAAATATVNLNLISSTISGNRAESLTGIARVGGLQAITGNGTSRVNLALASSTIAGNSATGATNQFGGLSLVKGVTAAVTAVTSKNTLVAGNTSATDADCRAAGVVITSGDFNLYGVPGSCTFTGAVTGNRTGAPGLSPLADNGGPTKTHALAAGSQAINTGNTAGCTDLAGVALPTDQRGLPRAARGRCDIGAFELQ